MPSSPRWTSEEILPSPGYRLNCPDVVEVEVTEHPETSVTAAIDLDGRLPLTEKLNPRIEGLTLSQARSEIARVAGVSEEQVRLRLAAPRSAQIYVHGPIRSRLQMIPYQGPEPVMDLLRRIGGLPPGSKLNEVYVVRPNVARGQKARIYHIDVEAILLDNDQRTNLVLQPSDVIYVGETRRSSFSRILPDWLRPLYRKLTGLLPDDWRPWNWIVRERDEGESLFPHESLPATRVNH